MDDQLSPDRATAEPTEDDDVRAADRRLRESLGVVVDGATVSLVGQTVGRLLATVVVAAVSTAAGAAGYGVYAVGQRVYGQISRVARAAPAAITRFVPARTTDSERSFVVLLAVAVGLLVAGVLGGVVALVAPRAVRLAGRPPALGAAIALFALAAPAAILHAVASAVLRTHHRIVGSELILRVGRPGGRLAAAAVGIAVAWTAAELVAGTVVALWLVGLAVAGVVGVTVVGRWGRPALHRPLARRMLGFVARNAVGNVARGLQTASIFVVLAYYESPDALGAFGAAVVLAGLVRWPLNAINQLVPPVAADLYSDGAMPSLRRLHAVSSRLVLLAAAPVAVALVVNRRRVLGALDPAYAGSAELLPAVVAAELVAVAVGSVGILLVSTDGEGLHMRINVGFALAALVVTVALVRAYGVAGGALAYLFAQAGNNVVELAALWWHGGFQPFERAHALPLVAGGGAAGAGVVVTTVGPVASVIATVVVYLAVVRVAGIPAIDRAVLAAALGRGTPAAGTGHRND